MVHLNTVILMYHRMVQISNQSVSGMPIFIINLPASMLQFDLYKNRLIFPVSLSARPVSIAFENDSTSKMQGVDTSRHNHIVIDFTETSKSGEIEGYHCGRSLYFIILLSTRNESIYYS
jgi:hypothetical protein